ncbi:MAG: lysophospholipid acyltransferase family protein [Actinomycetota bacterium]
MKEPVDELFPRYSRAAYPALKFVIGGSIKRMYRVRVEGLENVPSSGNGIVAANHISFLDSFFIPSVVARRMTYLAKAEYWDSWKTRWFFELGGQIPIRRQETEKSQAALDAGLRVLNKGGLLGIYPEGTRSPDGVCYRGKTGVARMAMLAGAPVVPTGVIGTREIMSKDAKMPRLRGDVTLRFGTPISITQAEVDDDPLAMRTFVDRLMYEIVQLSGQDYRDHYAGREPKPQPRELETVSAA